MAQTAKDYLALIALGGGCGTWYRDASDETAISRCVKMAYQDARSIFKLDGQTVSVNLFDVSGCGEVHVSNDGAWIEDGDGKRKWLDVARVEKRVFPGKRKAA